MELNPCLVGKDSKKILIDEGDPKINCKTLKNVNILLRIKNTVVGHAEQEIL